MAKSPEDFRTKANTPAVDLDCYKGAAFLRDGILSCGPAETYYGPMDYNENASMENWRKQMQREDNFRDHTRYRGAATFEMVSGGRNPEDPNMP